MKLCSRHLQREGGLGVFLPETLFRFCRTRRTLRIEQFTCIVGLGHPDFSETETDGLGMEDSMEPVVVHGQCTVWPETIVAMNNTMCR